MGLPRAVLRVSLALDLRRFSRRDFRHTLERADLSGHTDALASVRRLRLTELRTVGTPDDQRKHLIGIGLIEVQESGTAVTAFRPSRADHLAADSRLLFDVCFGLGRREGLLG